MILYVEIRSSWGKYEELAQYLVRNISREKYFSRGIFLARYWANSSYFPHKEWKLMRNIPREK